MQISKGRILENLDGVLDLIDSGFFEDAKVAEVELHALRNHMDAFPFT